MTRMIVTVNFGSSTHPKGGGQDLGFRTMKTTASVKMAAIFLLVWTAASFAETKSELSSLCYL